MKRLTKKQRGFLKDYEATGNATEAAMRNYDVKSRDVANAIGAENLAKPSITAVLEKDAVKAEMDRAYMMQRLKEHVDQDEERMASIRAIEVAAKITRLLNDNPSTIREDIPSDIESRAREAARGIGALAQSLAQLGSGFALFVEHRDIGIQPSNGEATQGDMPIHRDMEQA